eukprot:COSAG01_NODE_6583_length_3593_cov_42.311391_4_plen_124_part_00
MPRVGVGGPIRTTTAIACASTSATATQEVGRKRVDLAQGVRVVVQGLIVPPQTDRAWHIAALMNMHVSRGNRVRLGVLDPVRAAMAADAMANIRSSMVCVLVECQRPTPHLGASCAATDIVAW